MAERTRGIYRLVTIPNVYKTIQGILAGSEAQRNVADLLFTSLEGKRVLEIGCGPGGWSSYLSHTESYVGVDWNPSHIETAKAKNSAPNVRFICGDLSDPAVIDDIGQLDVVIGIGILHHLDDAIAKDLLSRISYLLGAGGHYVGIEPVLHAGQNPIARLLKALDSGRNIRREPSYRQLFASEYSEIETVVRTDIMRFPYSHVLLNGLVR